jgi:C4-dicarboxylate-specific signal transduction histidine kinase
MLLLPHLPAVTACVAAGTLAGGAYLVALDGRGTSFALEWGVLSLLICALALIGAIGFRRVWFSEVEAHRARSEALTQLAASEGRRARAERLALVGQLAAGVAHEINNPLSFVKSNLQFLKRGGPAEEQREAVDEALQGIDRIAQIVGDLRGLARDEGQEDVLLSVEDVLDEAWRLASTRLRSVRAQREVAPGLPQVRANRRSMVQALVNLLANAVEAAETADTPARRWVTARAEAVREGVAIIIEDGGPGLSPEVARRLFEPFFTTKGAKGTGLGLALVREQVGRCGGTVEGVNRVEGGARFTIWLPQAAPVPAPAMA